MSWSLPPCSASPSSCYLRTGWLLVGVKFQAMYNRLVPHVLSPEVARGGIAVVLIVVVMAWPFVDRVLSWADRLRLSPGS